jgi:hypothetical protein
LEKELKPEEISPLIPSMANGLLKYSIENPPSATKPNAKFIPFLGLFGGALTTYLAIPMLTRMFHKEQLTNEYLEFWTILSASLYSGVYLLLSKKTFNFYWPKVTSAWKRITSPLQAKTLATEGSGKCSEKL